MIATMQGLVQRRYHALLMSIIGLGFILVFVELLNYHHYRGAQLIGLLTTVIGAVASFLSINARGGLRRALIVIFLILSLMGLLGTWFHNEDRIMGEDEQRPANGQTTGGGPTSDDDQVSGTAPVTGTGQTAGGQNQPGGQRPGGRGQQTPPPLLAPLSLSGFCLLGTVVLLGRKDDTIDG